jgi:hypothetical protein
MADPKVGDGARLERRAWRERLRRQIRAYRDSPDGERWMAPAVDVLQEELAWVLARQKRYDRAKGGLGRARRAK